MKMMRTIEYAIEIRLMERPQRPSRKGPKGIAFLPTLRMAMREIGSKYDMY